jgi:hypothetical protein
MPGYVLLDTGATYNAVSPAARASRDYGNPSGAIPLRGGAGAIDGLPLQPGIRFRCGGQVLSAGPAVAVDLSDFARHHQIEVMGVLGYPALSRSILTIDYRDALVRIDEK